MSIIHDYVKPEWYGAKGDGVTDDSAGIQAAVTAAASSGAKVLFSDKTYRIDTGISYVTNTEMAKGILIEGAGMYRTIIDTRVENGYAFTFQGRTEYTTATFKYQFGSGISNLCIKTLAGTKPEVSGGIFLDCQYNFEIKNVLIAELTGDGIANPTYMNGVSADYGITQGMKLSHVFIKNCDGWGITNVGSYALASCRPCVLVTANDVTLYACGEGGWQALIKGATILNCNFGYNGYANTDSLGSGILFDAGGGSSQEVGIYESHFEANQHYNVCVLEGECIGFKRNRHISFLGAVGEGDRLLTINSPTSLGVPNLADLSIGVDGTTVSYVTHCNMENNVFVGAECPTYIAIALDHSAWARIENQKFYTIHASASKYTYDYPKDTDSTIIEENAVVTAPASSSTVGTLTINGFFYGRLNTTNPTAGGAYYVLAPNIIDGTSGGLTIYSLAAGTLIERVWIIHNGNVGINDPAPAEKLDVNGNINVTGVYKVGDVQVVGARGAAVADATDADSVILRLNELLARCRAHGSIAT